MRRVLLSSFIALFGFVAQSQAEITFGFTASAPAGPTEFVWNPPAAESAGSTTFNVNQGDAVRISVYLLQQGADTRLSDSGLFLASFDASFDATKGQVRSIIGKALPFSELAPVPRNTYRFPLGNDGPVFDNTAGTLSIGGGIDLDDPRPIPGIGTGEAFVGYFDFELTQPGAVTFTFSDPNPSPTFANNSLNDNPSFTNLDGELFANNGTSQTTLTLTTITAIPEPSSVMLLSGACGIVLLRRRRR